LSRKIVVCLDASDYRFTSEKRGGERERERDGANTTRRRRTRRRKEEKLP